MLSVKQIFVLLGLQCCVLVFHTDITHDMFKENVKRARDRRHLWCTQNNVCRCFPNECWNSASLLALSYNCWTEQHFTHFIFIQFCQQCPMPHTIKGFWEVYKDVVELFRCSVMRIFYMELRVNICSVVLISCPAPARSSAIISPTWGISLFRIIFNTFLLVTNQTDSPVSLTLW